MRHSWTWIDRLKPDRSQEGSQRLGRWKRWKSLTRYKRARLGSFWNQLAVEMPAHVFLCMDQFVEFLWSPKLAPRPPPVRG
eukprot:7892530-Pyramimonas_sp.AAC.1